MSFPDPIAVVVAESSPSAFWRALARAERTARVAELRLDALSDLAPMVAVLERLARHRTRLTLIATCRRRADGGHFAGSASAQLAVLALAARAGSRSGRSRVIVQVQDRACLDRVLAAPGATRGPTLGMAGAQVADVPNALLHDLARCASSVHTDRPVAAAMERTAEAAPSRSGTHGTRSGPWVRRSARRGPRRPEAGASCSGSSEMSARRICRCC